MAKKINLGKVGITAAGPYVSTRSYDRLTCVVFRGASWVAIRDVPSGVDPTYDKYWQLMAEKGQQGSQGEPGQSYVDKDLYPVVDNLTEGGSNKVLSAEQGKVLNEELAHVKSVIGDSGVYGLIIDGGRADTKYASLPVIDGGKANI